LELAVDGFSLRFEGLIRRGAPLVERKGSDGPRLAPQDETARLAVLHLLEHLFGSRIKSHGAAPLTSFWMEEDGRVCQAISQFTGCRLPSPAAPRFFPPAPGR